MTVNEFKIKHSTALKHFLSSEAGREFIAVLHQLRPLFLINAHPHIHHETSGAVRGFEQCEKSITFLSNLPVPTEEVEATYGVDKIVPK